MNRKLITSDKLNWPHVDELISNQILKYIENQLSKYPSIKRVKNPSKKQREKLKQLKSVEETGKNNKNGENDENIEISKSIKKHFIFGINSVTRCLENSGQNIMCVLVCRSTCKPLRLLTQHLLIMCSQKQIKAACIYNMSNVISKLFNINRVSAVAILDQTNDTNIVVNSILNEFKTNILDLLPDLVDPFVNNAQTLLLDDEVKLENDEIEKESVECEETITKFKHINDIFSFKTKPSKLIESKPKFENYDFMSFNEREEDNDADISNENTGTLTNFNDKHFILLDESVIQKRDDVIMAENDTQFGVKKQRYYNEIMPTKENTKSKKKQTLQFKQFDISIKKANKIKSKERNRLKNDLLSKKTKKQQKQKIK